MTMEKVEIEVSDESKIKLETEGGSVLKLGNHLGKLLVVLELAGLPVTEGKNDNRRGILDIMRRVCFPLFLHLSCLYLLYERLSKGTLTYGIVIDTALPILPCIMWIMMRCRNTSLNLFFVDLNRATSGDFKSGFSFTVNIVCICFIFIYPLLLLGLRFYQGNEVNIVEVFRILQESLFPNTMALVYIAICYLILKKVQFCKKLFLEELDLTSPTAVPMMKDYLNVAKCIEGFENLFCSVAFVILLHDLLIVTILVIDMFVDVNFMKLVLYEGLTEILYAFFSLLIMAVCAGNISVEIAAVKSVLSQQMFTQLDQGDATSNEKRINLLLKKNVCSLTVGKTLVFDRGFILKVVIFVLAEGIFISSIIH